MALITLEIETEQMAYDIESPPAGLWSIVVKNSNEEIETAYAGVNPWVSVILSNGFYTVQAKRSDDIGNDLGEEISGEFFVDEISDRINKKINIGL